MQIYVIYYPCEINLKALYIFTDIYNNCYTFSDMRLSKDKSTATLILQLEFSIVVFLSVFLGMVLEISPLCAASSFRALRFSFSFILHI